MPAVLVLGGSGDTGRLVVRYLVQNTDSTIRVLARDAVSASKVLLHKSILQGEPPQRVEIVQGDVTRVSDVRIGVRGVYGVVFCVGGSNMFNLGELLLGISNKRSLKLIERDAVETLCKVMLEENVQKVVMLSAGYVTRPFGFPTMVLNLLNTFDLRYKFEAEAMIRRSGIAYTIVRPGLLTREEAEEKKKVKVVQGDRPTGGQSRISRVLVGKFLARCLSDSSTDGLSLEITESVDGEFVEEIDCSRLKKDERQDEAQVRKIVREHEIVIRVIAWTLVLFWLSGFIFLLQSFVDLLY